MPSIRPTTAPRIRPFSSGAPATQIVTAHTNWHEDRICYLEDGVIAEERASSDLAEQLLRALVRSPP